MSRFRRPSGTVAVVDWATDGPPGDSVAAAVVVLDGAFRRVDGRAGRAGRAGTFTVPLADTAHVALQVDGGGATGVVRVGPVGPLPAEGLVLSDLRLLAFGPGGGPSTAGPLPVGPAAPGARLALEAEVYGLARGADGLARYTVEVETGPEGGGGPERIATQTTFTTAETRARHRFAVDPGARPARGALRLVLRVHDDVGGGTATRAVVLPP